MAIRTTSQNFLGFNFFPYSLLVKESQISFKVKFFGVDVVHVNVVKTVLVFGMVLWLGSNSVIVFKAFTRTCPLVIWRGGRRILSQRMILAVVGQVLSNVAVLLFGHCSDGAGGRFLSSGSSRRSAQIMTSSIGFNIGLHKFNLRKADTRCPNKF